MDKETFHGSSETLDPHAILLDVHIHLHISFRSGYAMGNVAGPLENHIER